MLGASATQKGPLWWAGGHRRHHKYSDLPGDMHSPRDGFWYSHQGWILDTRGSETELERIRDFAKFPELVWLNRWHFVPPLLLASLCARDRRLLGRAVGLRACRRSLLWHTTYSINSLAHRWGTRALPDRRHEPQQLRVLALLTLGEGWHNNHHWYMTSARQGFFWWEIDITYYVLRALALVGVVWDLREVPAHIRAARGGRYSTRIVAFLISSFSSVWPLAEPDFSSAFSVSMPFTTSPKTVCLPSR